MIRPKCHRETRAFSLIELLVVVAIIAILISMLMPALIAAKQISKKIVCLNNQKQLAVAMASYQADANSHFPSTTSFISWDDRLSGYDGRTLSQWQIDGWTPGISAPGMADAETYGFKTYVCPNDENPLPDPGLVGTRSRRTYSLNWGRPLDENDNGGRGISEWHISDVWTMRVEQVNRPDQSIIMSEHAIPGNEVGMGANAVVTAASFNNNNQHVPPDPAFWMHGYPKLNYLFADGHAQTVSFADTYLGVRTWTSNWTRDTMWDCQVND